MMRAGQISGCCLAALTAVGAVLAAPEARAEVRLTLVIGNDRYDTLPDLNNATTDARGMAARLGALGFEVIVRLNAGRRGMGRALAEFEDRARTADVALVFYAGHGIQSAGKNYLIPSDAQVEMEADLPYEGIEAGAFLAAMAAAGSRLNIMIIDACRDNPLPRRGRSVARGLTVTPAPAGGKGTVIIYSAAPGQTAQDGPKGGHGVFTGALLRVLDQPGLNLEQVFKQTARRVARATGGRQDPWINSSLKAEFFFNAAVPAGAAAGRGGGAAELLFWKSIKDGGETATFRAYLKQYPQGAFAALARLKLEGRRQDDGRTEARGAGYVAVKTANIRAAPAATAAKLGSIARDHGVTVTGAAAGGKWLRIRRPGGGAGYIFATSLARAEEGEIAAWNNAKDDPTAPGIRAFPRLHSDGHFARRARRSLAALGKAGREKLQPAAEAKFSRLQGFWHGETLGCGMNSFGYSRDISVSLAISDGKITGKIRETAEASTYGVEFTTTAAAAAASIALGKFYQVAALLKLKFDTEATGISAKFDGCPMELTRN